MIEYNHHERFILAVAFGLGLLVFGGLEGLSKMLSARTRLWLGALSGLLGVALLDFIACGLPPFLLACSAAMFFSTAILPIAIRRANLLPRWCASPLFQPGMGACIVTLASAQYQVDETRSLDLATEQMMATVWHPPMAPSPVVALTDFGTVVPLNDAMPTPQDVLNEEEALVLENSPFRDSVIRREPASDGSNCHGWVFTGGQHWVVGASVDRILTENCYQAVDDPKPGDLVVYRRGGQTVHTAVVRDVTPGHEVLVEGKWSWMGVFLHPIGRTPYGDSYTFYRTGRGSHLLECVPEAEAALHGTAE